MTKPTNDSSSNSSPGATLTEEQVRLCSRLRPMLRSVNSKIVNHQESDQGELKKMSELARELHLSLKKSGKTPMHGRQLIKNRGLPPDDSEFYENYHTVESLLAFAESISDSHDQ